MAGLLVLADDLTGANDTSVSYADAGYSTVLLQDRHSLAAIGQDLAEVYALSSDSRANSGAEEVTRELAAAAMEQGISAIYLKIDSTMRGFVAEQIRGVLSAWRSRYDDAIAVVCPAFPVMGRTVDGGICYVNGVRLIDTPSGQDAICPVGSSSMAELLPGAIVLEPEVGLADRIQSAGSDIVAVDARTESDLHTIADACRELGPRVIPVGSAGLAGAHREALGVPRGTSVANPLPLTAAPLMVITSIHATSQSQVDEYIASDAGLSAAVFSPHPAQLQRDEALAHLSEQVRALAVSSDQPLIIRANPARLASGPVRETLARDFAAKLAKLALVALSERDYGGLVAVGGDGAAALQGALGITRSRVMSSLAPGVPLTVAEDGGYPGLPIVTKSGGFGEKDLLSKIVDTLWKETQ